MRDEQSMQPMQLAEPMQAMMLAVRLHPEGIRIDEIEPPSPGAGEVLVRVHAAAITRGELEWPSDRLPAIVSYELSGVVADTGEEVFALTPFDRDGVAAEYAAVPASMLAPKPASLSHAEAAALPMGGLSAWQGLFEHGRLRRGERVIVTGARGGVGHLAVQLARHAGADVVEDGPADLVFDTVGGSLPAADRVVTIAAEAPGADYFIVGPNREQLSELARLVDGGELRPAVDSTFPLERARAAFERVSARGKRGKVVFDVAGS
jgi:NADPH:quinone reductase-like Zn-dependent oxidoreductase